MRVLLVSSKIEISQLNVISHVGADVMDWACLHAKARGYRYWTGFTTGKSVTLGGIPHDLYGMTTRGVHEYVLGLLKKLNIKEESIFKLQTGGPDGDLGSNEIKISKDKTKVLIIAIKSPTIVFTAVH